MSKTVTLKNTVTGETLLPNGGGAKGAAGNGVNVTFQPLARIDIDSELLTPNATNNTISPLTTSKNEVGADQEGDPDGSVTLTFARGGETWTDDIIIAYQGNTSLQDAKKGFSVDFANKHRFGEWLEMDSFHLKAYYTDWLHARDLVSNALLEQIYLSRPISHRRAYMKNNNFAATDYRQHMDIGATCHINGFPAEIYINGVYWGLYSLNIKKNRDNYFLKKNEDEHIMVEVGTEGMLKNGAVLWTSCEFRNPKTVTNMDGTKYDGDHPQEIADGDVKTAWQRFATFLAGVTSSTTEEDIAEYIDIEELIDNVVFDEVLFNLDVFRNNTLWTTWDGTIWSPLMYDMDKTFGKAEAGFPGSTDSFFPPNLDVFALYADIKCPEIKTIREILADKIAERYAELRDNGIFSVENISRLFDAWTRTVGADVYKRDLSRWPSYPTLSTDSVQRCLTWLGEHLAYVDQKYNY